MITPERFRLFEHALLCLFTPRTAELLSMVVAAYGLSNGPHAMEAPPVLALDDRGALDIDRVAVETNQDLRAVCQWLQEVERETVTILECTPFVGLGQLRRGELPKQPQIPLTLAFRDLIDGTALHIFDPQAAPAAGLADHVTAAWLDRVAGCVRQRAGAAFLYRRGPLPPLAEYGRLLSDLADRLGEGQIFMAGEGTATPATVPTLYLLLSALLHVGEGDLLVLPQAKDFGARIRDVKEDLDARGDDEPREEVPEANVCRLLSQLTCCTLVAIPPQSLVAPHVAALFSGAFGPYAIDLAQAAEALVASSPDQALGIREASNLVRVFGDPAHAAAVLKTAACLATEAWSQDRSGAGGEAGDWVEEAAAAVFGWDRATLRDRGFQQRYNRLAAELTDSLAPHLARNDLQPALSTARFDPELFISQPAADRLFEGAAALREAGARIILAGPPGTGKTALVGELARRMGLRALQFSAASLFARAWGQAERNIDAAFRTSRGCLLFLDEADALMGARDSGDDHHSHLTVTATNAFLTALQEPSPNSPVVIATNRLSALDAGIRRRFDLVLETQTLPAHLELVAWRRLIGLIPPEGWRPIGETVPGDYVKAKRQMVFLGEEGPRAAARAIARARQERDGAQHRSKPGFL